MKNKRSSRKNTRKLFLFFFSQSNIFISEKYENAFLAATIRIELIFTAMKVLCISNLFTFKVHLPVFLSVLCRRVAI